MAFCLLRMSISGSCAAVPTLTPQHSGLQPFTACPCSAVRGQHLVAGAFRTTAQRIVTIHGLPVQRCVRPAPRGWGGRCSGTTARGCATARSSAWRQASPPSLAYPLEVGTPAGSVNTVSTHWCIAHHWPSGGACVPSAQMSMPTAPVLISCGSNHRTLWKLHRITGTWLLHSPVPDGLTCGGCVQGRCSHWRSCTGPACSSMRWLPLQCWQVSNVSEIA